MKKILSIILAISIIFILGACSKNDTAKTVVIYSSAEDFRNEYFIKRIKEEFPEYEIEVQYFPSGNNAAKLKAEGLATECDIILALETGYMEAISTLLADLSEYDVSHYQEDIISKDANYLIWERFSGAIIINPSVLEKNNLEIPKSYDDLLKSEYKGFISMPNPKSSITGYIFMKNILNVRGEDEGFKYFDKLSENILQFTSSGSGPIKALVQEEVGIGLALTYAAVNEINKGSNLEIVFFEEGAPYSLDGIAMIEGKSDNKEVRDVFNFFADTLIYEDKQLFSPEKIFNEQIIEVESFPYDIKYADMTGIDDLYEKDTLLERWKY
jgi:ABC-type thiamine transport system, periplasmic component